LKKSKIPSALLKLLPKGIGGSESSGQSFILEKTVVDVGEGWMTTESRNMEWTGILSVVERQLYERENGSAGNTVETPAEGEKVNVRTTVTFKSRLGQGKLLNRARKAAEEMSSSSESEEDAPKKGFFSSLSTAGIQRTIELIGVTRTRDAVLRSKEGMNIVLERLRNGGIVGVLEGMRRDREGIPATLMGGRPMQAESTSTWRNAWLQGTNNSTTPNKGYVEDGDD
jgi:hypothetical protein